MEEEGNLHDIFVKNPVELLGFVECFVKIVLHNGEVIKGTVYTIDPVSQSIVLITKESSGTLSLIIVLKHSVASMEELPEIPVNQQDVLKNDIFSIDKNSSSDKNHKEDVKNWLTKNMISVVEKGDVLLVDTVEIYPPYGSEQCRCSNSIVLSRIQNLLKEIPLKNS